MEPSLRDRVTPINLLLVAAAMALYWVVNTLSNRWISKRERKVLREATGREPRKGEEGLLGTWL
jgi:hypothetical protein